jgi:hypothetical protein
MIGKGWLGNKLFGVRGMGWGWGGVVLTRGNGRWNRDVGSRR